MTQDNQPERWSTFGWNVLETNGNDIESLDLVIKKAKELKGKPTVIIANTIKGFGYTEAEDNVQWHHKVPNKEQYEAAKAELLRREADVV
jgi:transketolase